MSLNTVKNKSQIILTKYLSGKSISYQQVIAIIIPILVDQAFVIFLNLINTAMISSSGVAAISAVNMVDSLNNFFVSVIIAVATGGTVVVAQYKGTGNDAMVSKASAGSVSSVFLLAFAVGFLAVVFHNATLNLLFGAAEADVFRNARVYLIGSGLSYCGIAIEEAVCGALRGIGETRSTLFLSMIMNFSYVLINIVTINILHMGVLGLSVSLNISRYLGAACALVYVMKINTSLHFHALDMFLFELSMLKRILFIGLPFAAEQMFFNGGKILTQTFIVKLGTYAIDVNAICSSLAGLFQIPGNALCLAVVTVVGQCVGRRDVEDARKFIRSFVLLSSFSFVLTSLMILPVFSPLVSLFHPPAKIVPSIFTIIIINAVAQTVLWSVSFVTPSALRAAGDSKYTSVVSMLSMWLFRVVLGYILGIILPFGIVGVWVAMDCEWGVRGAIFLRRYRGNKWYAHHLID